LPRPSNRRIAELAQQFASLRATPGPAEWCCGRPGDAVVPQQRRRAGRLGIRLPRITP